MTLPAQPQLEPGRVYRTRDLAAWSKNPPRLAKRLVDEGALVPLAHGLFACPKQSRFGRAPPTDAEMLRGLLDGAPFVMTGPEKWNALGLGSTAVSATALVYNAKRTGMFDLGGRRYELRRVKHPEVPTKEWFAIDLLEHADRAGASKSDLVAALGRAVARGAFDRELLLATAKSYATKATQAALESVLVTAPP